MSGYVVDASVAVEFLLRTPIGQEMARRFASESALLVAPELIDVEVLSTLRREVLSRRLVAERAERAIAAMLMWPIERISIRLLVPLAWEHYQNVSAYDALYVAAARLRNLPLLTVDGPLSRAPGLPIDVQHVRVG